MATQLITGLEDVVAADSAITWIDGQAGELRYRGYPIGELAGTAGLEAIAYLLWHGELPSAGELDALKGELRSVRMVQAPVEGRSPVLGEGDEGGHARTRPLRPDGGAISSGTDLEGSARLGSGAMSSGMGLVGLVEGISGGAHPLDVLRYVLSWDALGNPLAWNNDPGANLAKSVQMTAWFPVIVAAYHRRRRGERPIAPRPDLDTAANFLYMLHGREAADVAVRTLDMSLVLHADHELNASTFAARVTIATQSNLHAAIASALGTLAGPRHGGASDRVITMLEEVGTPERAEVYVREELAARRRIMGFGHRVYRTADPRSGHLRSMAAQMVAGTPHESWIEILDRLGEIMAREKSLYPNVDLFAAVVNHELGVDPAFYTSVFAISRITGWTAHAMEQLDGRMIRPVARYTGPGLRHVR